MSVSRIKLENQNIELPIVTGSMGEKAIDITNLRKESGFITLDYGFQSTGSCVSSITFTDGEKGILKYRGIDITELAEKASFIDVAYFLIFGEFPGCEEKAAFSQNIKEHALPYEGIIRFLQTVPVTAHPMAVLSNMVNAMSMFHHLPPAEEEGDAAFKGVVSRLLSQSRTLAAFFYKRTLGEPFVYPRDDLGYCGDFLNMMFDNSNQPYQIEAETERLMNVIFILHADHEQNCSTSSVRLVGSSRVNLYASVCAGINALWGPMHGGANQMVIEMLERIHNSKMTIKEVIQKAKDKNDPFKLFGFGHRVYHNLDPRMKILKKEAQTFLVKRKLDDPIMDIALEMEEAVTKDDYFLERKLYPNVDFYAGILFREMGFPTNMFTVIFALGRMAGWIAQWKEMDEIMPFKIARPRQIYTGPVEAHCPE